MSRAQASLTHSNSRAIVAGRAGRPASQRAPGKRSCGVHTTGGYRRTRKTGGMQFRLVQGPMSHVQGASLKGIGHDLWRVFQPWIAAELRLENAPPRFEETRSTGAFAMAYMSVNGQSLPALYRYILSNVQIINTAHGPVIAAPLTLDMLDELFVALGSIEDLESGADAEHSVQFAHATDFFRSPYSDQADAQRHHRRCVAPRIPKERAR